MARFRCRLPRGVKRLTNPVFGRIPIVIVSGPNKGLRWSLASAGSGYGSGRRESAQLTTLARLLHAGDTAWDIGAHHGFVSLCMAMHVGPHGRVHTFEPGRVSRWFLQKHVSWNKLTNVTIFPYALGARDGDALFGGGETSKQDRLGGGPHVVAVRTVDSLIATGECGVPTFLKIDVEGGEADVLKHGIRALDPSVRLLVAIHSEELYERCIPLFNTLGYRTYESSRLRRYRRTAWHGDADIVAFGPQYSRADQDLEMLEQLDY